MDKFIFKYSKHFYSIYTEFIPLFLRVLLLPSGDLIVPMASDTYSGHGPSPIVCLDPFLARLGVVARDALALVDLGGTTTSRGGLIARDGLFSFVLEEIDFLLFKVEGCCSNEALSFFAGEIKSTVAFS